MSTPKKGDLVDITIRGAEVLRVDDQRLYVYHDSSHLPAPAHFFLGGTNIEIEILPPPEPEWQPGDVGVCEHGYSCLRSIAQNWIAQDGTVSDSECARKLIARNGKPVTSP